MTIDARLGYQLEQDGHLPDAGISLAPQEKITLGGLAVTNSPHGDLDPAVSGKAPGLSGVHPSDLAIMQAVEPRLEYLDIDTPDVLENEPPEQLITHVLIPGLERALHELMQAEHLELLGIQGALASTKHPIDRIVEYVDGLELRARVGAAPAMLGVGFDRPDAERHITIIGSPEYERGDHIRLSPTFIRWLLAYPRQVRESLLPVHPNDAMAALPLIAVYDPNKLLPGLKYGAHLLPDTPSWADAVIKAFVLPYPATFEHDR